MERQKSTLRAAAAVLCIFMIVFCLTGCKYSPKLHELIQDRFDHLLDTKSAKEFEDDFNRVETSDEVTAKEQNDQSERKKEENESKPVESEDEEEETQQTASNPVLSSSGTTKASASGQKTSPAAASSSSSGNSSSGNSGQASSGGAVSTQGTGTSSGGTGQGSSGSGTSGSGTGGSGTSGDGTGGTGEQGTEVVPGSGGSRNVVDNRGDLENVPENVASAACTSSSAVFFCAAGGEGLIKASSESFISSPYLSSSVGSQIQSLWSGDGTGMMSEDAFAALLTLKPEVVVEISGYSTLSEDQISQLLANEISYVVLPVPDSLENIKEDVKLAGKMTGTGGRTGDGNALASQYSEYADQLANDIQSRVKGSGSADLGTSASGRYNGKCSLYIEGWDDGASYSIGIISGSGVAYTGNNMTSSFQLMNELMDIGGVYNKMNVQEDVRAKEYWVTPLKKDGTDKLNVSPTMDLKETSKKLVEYTSDYLLGTDMVPGIIVHDQAAASSLQSDRLWDPGSWTQTTAGKTYGIYTNAEHTAYVSSSVDSEFETYVNPCGLGSWDGMSQSGSFVGGSPESILECAWIASCFYSGSYSSEELKNEISTFYSQFYGISLSGDQIETITAGRAG